MYTIREEETMGKKYGLGEEEAADSWDVLRVQIKINTNIRLD